MFKLFNKKLNKKGFTLAELLVVVAIIAILIAIAVPIFTKSMREAQLRTNQANMRSVKAAGVTEILSDWGKYHMANTNTAAAKWLIAADVDVKGNISHVKVYPNADEFDPEADADGIKVGTGEISLNATQSAIPNDCATGIEIANDDDEKQICNVSASSDPDANEHYWVYVWVSDVDFQTP